ncbi:Proteasome-interacting protein CIC1 [Meyerozyma sp. JA9]|nr:Proteasome-interacting protein CIC1 [Meyerozyma sp. JA9]
MARTRSQKGSSSPLTKGMSSPKVSKIAKSKKSEAKASPKASKPKEPAAPKVNDLSSARILKAVKALAKFVAGEAAEKESSNGKAQLFDDNDENKSVFVQINTKKFQASKPNFKPKTIKLSHSIHDDGENNFKVCLILRDQLITSEEQLSKVEDANLRSLHQIVSLDTLKKEYKNFEKRRQFYSEYDMFLFDDALMNLMPTLLGKTFYGKGNSKLPIPIRVTSTSNPKALSLDTVKNQLEKALSSTAYLLPVGVNISIKVGSFAGPLSNEEVAANISDVISSFDLSSLKSILLKTEASPALPLFETEKLFDEEDVQKEEPEENEDEDSTGVKLSAYEKGLLELGDPDEVAKLIGKKMGQTVSKERTKKTPKPAKVTKPSKKTKSSKK